VSNSMLEGEADASLCPYEAIHEHAELELQLAGQGEIDRLVELAARWEELTHGLPARPPARAAKLLAQAHLIHERTHIELIRLRESLLAEISTTTHVRRVADGYGSQLPRSASLDRTA
jgi:hypothetical protein